MTEDGAVEWMAKNGHRGYAAEINELTACINETIAEAGRYWHLDEWTLSRVEKLTKAIEEVKQAALDRYEDWASDPLD